jgi:hypothetical protein
LEAESLVAGNPPQYQFGAVPMATRQTWDCAQIEDFRALAADQPQSLNVI